MSPLYLNTLYLDGERVLSTEAAMFFTVVQTGQTKPFEFLGHLEAAKGSPSCVEGKGEVMGI